MTETSLLPVEPVDREAAASAYGISLNGLVQAFARHRIAERDRAAGIAEAEAKTFGRTAKGTALAIATAIRSPSLEEG